MEGKVFYITKQKLQELKKEYEQLVAFERHKILGDESPKILESEDVNLEFISFQEDINFLRSRMDEVKNVLEHYELIKNPPKEKQTFVNLGAKVKLEIGGKQEEFKIVGTLEANPNIGKISNESPIGKALLGHQVGDEVVLSAPTKIVYKIKKIKYESA